MEKTKIISDKDIEFLNACNLYPSANNSLQVLTENDEGAWLDKETILKYIRYTKNLCKLIKGEKKEA